MGVTGLWRLIEPAGKPVPLETLENKVLAIDISIWLHQVVKGYQDARGGTVVNAHLLGLFQRLCKLLYYKIKPVFVFDGGVPVLKIQTISRRQSNKSKMHKTVERMRKQLLEIVTKQMAVGKVISEKNKSPTKKSLVKPVVPSFESDDTLFKLPPVENNDTALEESDDSDSEHSHSMKHMDLHSVDINSQYFKNLSLKEKHDLLTELKETRKQNSWRKIHELPTQSDGFSDYQMQRLLKRRQVQVSLEETEKEMGGHYLSLNELEILLNEEGIDTKIEALPTRQIASDENTRFLLIKDVKEALETATKKDLEKNTSLDGNKTESSVDGIESKAKSDLGNEYDEDLEAALQLSLQCFDPHGEPSSSNTCAKDYIDASYSECEFVSSGSEWESDDESDVVCLETEEDKTKTNLGLVKAYMLENSGLTEHEIKKIINKNTKDCFTKTNKEMPIIDKVKGGKNQNVEFVKEDTPSTSSTVLVHEKVNNECKEKIPQENVINLANLDDTVAIRNEHFIEQDILQNDDVVKSASVNLINDSLGKIIQMKKNVNYPNQNLRKSLFSKSVNAMTNPSKEKLSSDSDTDDSFEEVECSEEKKCKIEIDLNIQIPPENDIFADIFKDETEKKTLQNIYQPPVNEITNKSNDDKNVCKDIEKVAKNDKLHGHKNESNIKDPIIDEKENNTIKCDECNAITHQNSSTNEITVKDNENVDCHEVTKSVESINNDSEMQENECSISQKTNLFESPTNRSTVSSNYSPQKGMTLIEVRQLASQENVNKTDAIASQLISTDDLMNIADDLEKEKEKLEKDQNKLDRMGRNISEEMTKDAQDLLKMFGIPYIVAPMEAEAQCAFLEAIKLTDGTITDDSDIWLFGGRNVYKNFFNQQKYVLQFLSENIKNCFKLTREQLILLALLVGSDYTTGVPGVGPVTAMEILSTFPPSNLEIQPQHLSLIQGLKKFKSWWCDNRAYGHGKLRNKLKNISLNQDFPSHKVVEAYLDPQVDKNNESFSWGKPDVTALRDYAKQKFGWSQNKTDEMLKPVLKRLDEKISQQSIRSFFQTEIKNAAALENMSKRVRKAVERMESNADSEDEQKSANNPKKRKKNISDTQNVSSSRGATELLDNKNKRKKISDKCDPQTSSSSLKSNIQKVVKEGSLKDISPVIPGRYQETIPQRECDKALLMKNKMKAIEVFRTSKKGPGFIKKGAKRIRQPKLDAELSESDSN